MRNIWLIGDEAPGMWMDDMSHQGGGSNNDINTNKQTSLFNYNKKMECFK